MPYVLEVPFQEEANVWPPDWLRTCARRPIGQYQVDHPSADVRPTGRAGHMQEGDCGLACLPENRQRPALRNGVRTTRPMPESVMAIASVRCPVLAANVIRVTDLEGSVTRIICPEYVESTGSCRRITNLENGAPLSRLLQRVADDALDQRTSRCRLH